MSAILLELHQQISIFYLPTFPVLPQLFEYNYRDYLQHKPPLSSKHKADPELYCKV